MSAPRLDVSASPEFLAWLVDQGLSLAFTTYRVGKLFFVGSAQGRLSLFERTFNRCMGLWSAGDTLLMSSLYQVWRFENMLRDGESYRGYDRLYVPRVGYTTGDLDVHDLGLDASGRVVFVNTRFNCVAAVDERHSFVPLWTPPWISRLAPEDRAHLNGLAFEDGKARYLTAVAQSDVADGWRTQRESGGCVVDILDGQVVVAGLSMPHSPRMHEGHLWVLEAGTGHLGKIDRSRGVFEPVCFCPGFLRGLAFHGHYAVVGSSKPRDNRAFTGLPLEAQLAERRMSAVCGIHVVDLRRGSIVAELRLEGMIDELYDVVTLVGARRPMALGFVNDEIHAVLSVGAQGTL